MYDTSLSKIHQRYGAMQKENKRCIPKEGMPHASACQKNNNKICIPKEGMTHASACQKKGKKKRQPLIQKERKRKERDGAYKGVHTPSTKNIHTLAHLDQGL